MQILTFPKKLQSETVTVKCVLLTSARQQRRHVRTILVADLKQPQKLRRKEDKGGRGTLRGAVICRFHIQ